MGVKYFAQEHMNVVPRHGLPGPLNPESSALTVRQFPEILVYFKKIPTAFGLRTKLVFLE